MTATCITIAGKPFGKQRPRFRRKTGTAFTPKETVRFEDAVRALGALHFKRPIEGPVRIEVIASFAPPASWSQAKRKAWLGRHHTQRPDADNIVKAITDALNRIAFADDAQIAEVYARKVWGALDQTTVYVSAIE